MTTAIAIDIGGTKCEVGIVDDAGNVLRSSRFPTPGHRDGEHLLKSLTGLVDELGSGEEVVCGVGTGGPMTKGGVTVSPLNIKVWRDFPLLERLRDHVSFPVHIDNDAKALALGEGWIGAARGCPNFIAMVVSTGVGGGIVLDGRLLDGREGNAGHIGHMVVRPNGYQFNAYAPGVLEAEVSGTGIAHRSGQPASEADAEEMERAGALVGRAVGSTANLLDLQLCVIAGSVALGFGEPFFAAAQREIDAVATLDYSTGTKVIPAGLGSAGPLIGAAAVGWRGIGVDIGIR